MALLSIWGYAQGTESFANLANATGDGNGIITSYQGWSWTGDLGGAWLATDARPDQEINDEAITVRNGELSTTIIGGIGDLSLTTQRKFGGGSGNLNVKIDGNLVGTIPYGDNPQTTTLSDINLTGDLNLVIETPGNGDRIAMDDLIWTAPASGGVIGGDGETCGTAFVIGSLPFNDSGNTSDYGSNYSSADLPSVASNAITNGTGSASYINGILLPIL